MKDNHFAKLLAFLERLDKARIPYTLQHSRDNAIMVTTFAPGEYWEIEFIDNGDIDIERYRSNGTIYDESILPELFALCADDEIQTAEPVNPDGTTARN